MLLVVVLLCAHALMLCNVHDNIIEAVLCEDLFIVRVGLDRSAMTDHNTVRRHTVEPFSTPLAKINAPLSNEQSQMMMIHKGCTCACIMLSHAIGRWLAYLWYHGCMGGVHTQHIHASTHARTHSRL